MNEAYFISMMSRWGFAISTVRSIGPFPIGQSTKRFLSSIVPDTFQMSQLQQQSERGDKDIIT